MKNVRRPLVLVLYHYFHPDDVISARHYADLCTGLVERGWDVEVWPSNRACRNDTLSYPLEGKWNDVSIHRVWRPALRQASVFGRLANLVWMLGVWCTRIFSRKASRADAIILGTDPILSVLVALIIRRINPRLKIAHWCFDLYPESPIAEGMLSETNPLTRILRTLLRRAYGACNLIADLGECMRIRLDFYHHSARRVTLVPWALAEPEDVPIANPPVRQELFGSKSLGLLYSGNFGRAHSYTEFVRLARAMRDESVQFCFGVRGNRCDQLRAAVTPEDNNITFAGFVPESELIERLTAADIHLVSLQEDWTGTVVPSKFFGALAAGRPVLFAGSPQSAIAQWIEEYRIGWVLNPESLPAVAESLRRFARNPDLLNNLKARCRDIYGQFFSRKCVLDRWDQELRALLAKKVSA